MLCLVLSFLAAICSVYIKFDIAAYIIGLTIGYLSSLFFLQIILLIQPDVYNSPNAKIFIDTIKLILIGFTLYWLFKQGFSIYLLSLGIIFSQISLIASFLLVLHSELKPAEDNRKGNFSSHACT
jgi:hypothetical protein